MSYPRLIVLFPGIVARVNSWEQEHLLRRREVQLIAGCAAVLCLIVGIVLGWLAA